MIACNGCRKQIWQFEPRVIQPMAGGDKGHWHLKCYGPWQGERKVEHSKPTDSRQPRA